MKQLQLISIGANNSMIDGVKLWFFSPFFLTVIILDEWEFYDEEIHCLKICVLILFLFSILFQVSSTKYKRFSKDSVKILTVMKIIFSVNRWVNFSWTSFSYIFWGVFYSTAIFEFLSDFIPISFFVTCKLFNFWKKKNIKKYHVITAVW